MIHVLVPQSCRK